VASVGKLRAVVWDAAGGPVAYRNHPKSPQNGPGAFRPHRSVLAVGHGTVVDLWDFASGAELVLKGHKRPVWAVGFSPDGGTAYTAASDGAVIAWDADSGAVRERFDYGTGKLYSAAVSPDGLTLALGGDDGRVTVVDLDG
jgi:WD40 repeat protein